MNYFDTVEGFELEYGEDFFEDGPGADVFRNNADFQECLCKSLGLESTDDPWDMGDQLDGKLQYTDYLEEVFYPKFFECLEKFNLKDELQAKIREWEDED